MNRTVVACAIAILLAGLAMWLLVDRSKGSVDTAASREAGAPPPPTTPAVAGPTPSTPSAAASANPPRAAASSAPAAPVSPPSVAPSEGPVKLTDAELRDTLKVKKIRDVEFADTSLDQLAQFVRTVSGLPVHVSPKVRASAGDLRISVPRLEEVTCAELLDLVTAPHELSWTVRDGVLRIETKEQGTR